MSYLKVSSSLRKILTCVGYSSKCVCEVHSKTLCLPISKKLDIGFLREPDTFKSMV